MTVVDYYYLTGNKPNAYCNGHDGDRRGLVDLLADRLKFYAYHTSLIKITTRYLGGLNLFISFSFKI
ncbi:hypothetical protein MJ572_03405 [Escherichia coli]|nr:hypothetical protein MJ572_03405 [Escherichia coli]